MRASASRSLALPLQPTSIQQPQQAKQPVPLLLFARRKKSETRRFVVRPISRERCGFSGPAPLAQRQRRAASTTPSHLGWGGFEILFQRPKFSVGEETVPRTDQTI